MPGPTSQICRGCRMARGFGNTRREARCQWSTQEKDPKHAH